MKAAFQKTVINFYDSNQRNLPWRSPQLPLDKKGHLDPYKILVSEIMLQQTQVKRVEQKYREFISVFPNIDSLAQADLSQVLTVWQGLGYNRRALYLFEAAKALRAHEQPWSIEQLTAQRGIGVNTAKATIVYAYNEPQTFIETNIRSVFIHHFFEDQLAVTDTQILPLIERTLDKDSPRRWYWALMDYGAFIKATLINPSQRSKHYKKQSKFSGSHRQLRALVLKHLLEGPATQTELEAIFNDSRLQKVLVELTAEHFLTLTDQQYRVAK